MKTLLITGGAGFIGSNFVHWVLNHQPDVHLVNVDKLTYCGNLENLTAVEKDPRYRFVKADIADAQAMEQLFKANHFDAVINFAAETHVDRSILGPSVFLESNIIGTQVLLDLALQHKIPRFAQVSTDEVYGSLPETGAFTETTPLAPNSPYSASKAAADLMVRAYVHTYGLDAVITRCSNNYGPYQFPEKLIPLMVLNILEKKPLPVYGDGSNVRDWLYVIDHCEALLEAFESGRIGETYNIGGGAERKNIEIVELLCGILDRRLGRSGKDASSGLITFVKDRPGHDQRYAIDASKIEREIGWKPRYRFEDAIEATVGWYLDHMGWVDSVRSGQYREWIKDNYDKR